MKYGLLVEQTFKMANGEVMVVITSVNIFNVGDGLHGEIDGRIWIRI